MNSKSIKVLSMFFASVVCVNLSVSNLSAMFGAELKYTEDDLNRAKSEVSTALIFERTAIQEDVKKTIGTLRDVKAKSDEAAKSFHCETMEDKAFVHFIECYKKADEEAQKQLLSTIFNPQDFKRFFEFLIRDKQAETKTFREISADLDFLTYKLCVTADPYIVHTQIAETKETVKQEIKRTMRAPEGGLPYVHLGESTVSHVEHPENIFGIFDRAEQQ